MYVGLWYPHTSDVWGSFVRLSWISHQLSSDKTQINQWHWTGHKTKGN